MMRQSSKDGSGRPPKEDGGSEPEKLRLQHHTTQQNRVRTEENVGMGREGFKVGAPVQPQIF